MARGGWDLLRCRVKGHPKIVRPWWVSWNKAFVQLVDPNRIKKGLLIVTDSKGQPLFCSCLWREEFRAECVPCVFVCVHKYVLYMYICVCHCMHVCVQDFSKHTFTELVQYLPQGTETQTAIYFKTGKKIHTHISRKKFGVNKMSVMPATSFLVGVEWLKTSWLSIGLSPGVMKTHDFSAACGRVLN